MAKRSLTFKPTKRTLILIALAAIAIAYAVFWFSTN
jgi:hypothetical protein